jgi:hypothetical protein
MTDAVPIVNLARTIEALMAERDQEWHDKAVHGAMKEAVTRLTAERHKLLAALEEIDAIDGNTPGDFSLEQALTRIGRIVRRILGEEIK